jgi:hypothetical protein
MIKSFSNVTRELVGFIRESSAIIHYFSDIMVIISLHTIIFEQGELATFILWLTIALISAIIAEVLKSHLPTPLRIALRGVSHNLIILV